MTAPAGIFKGVVHGKTIELDQEIGLPDGQSVSITVRPTLAPGEGLKRAFGAWAEDGDELDRFMEQLHRDRQLPRPEIE
jgi:hypothetical protein